MKNIIKKILAIWIIIYLVVVPPFAHAVSAGGWAFSSFDVAKNLVTAMKNGATATATVAKSPITSKIAKGILGGAIAGAAIPLAISQISGIALSAVDWVLDPANNAIKYRKKGGDVIKGIQVEGGSYPVVATEMEACQAYFGTGSTCVSYNIVNDYYIEGCATTKTDPTPYCTTVGYYVKQPNDWKSVGIPTVANKIYDNAKTDTSSRSVVNDAVTQYVNEGSADTALDNAKADADASHACGTGTHWSGTACVADTPSTPSTPTTPDTPFDPSSIIDAINSVFNAVQSVFDAVMSLPDVINNALDDLLNDIKDFFQPVVDSVTNFFDWVKTTYDEFVKPDDSPTNVDIDVPQTQTIDTDINFGGSCPANITGSFVIGGQTTTFNIMDWSQFCLIMSTYLKPLVIALASYQAVKILAGRNESN